jgi:uncharacterized protein (TIGR03086 family)
MNVIDLHQLACDLFTAHVRAIGPGQWAAATPCAEWDVRGLVNHVTAEDLWTPPLLAGATIAQVGSRFDGDVLGAADAVAACARAAAGAVGAVSEADALRRTVHLSFGDTPAEEYMWQLFADHLIHSWDLARAIGADDRLDDGLVRACSSWYGGREDAYRTAGAVGPRPSLPAGASEQAVLLAGFGRAA